MEENQKHLPLIWALLCWMTREGLDKQIISVKELAELPLNSELSWYEDPKTGALVLEKRLLEKAPPELTPPGRIILLDR